MRRYELAITTDSSGNATVYTPRLRGLVHQIHYVKNDFADGIDFTFTDEETGNVILAKSNVNASAVFAPRQATHGQDGAAALYASAGTAVNAPIAVSGRIKVDVAQGGNAKSGTVHILVG